MNRDDLVLSMAPVVRFHALRLSYAIHDKSLKPDLEQCGWVGALQAAKKFKKKRKIKFKTFAQPRIHGAMLDFLKSTACDPMTRFLVSKGTRGSEITILYMGLFREP